MHIPDGFVSGPINGVTAVASLAALAYSARQARRSFKDHAFVVPLLATMAAFIFAAQMLNFPIGGGTSGHFLGAAIAAALLGPWSACLIMAVVLVIQGLLFADGGITALGSNIFNMGVIAGIAMYPVMRFVRGLLPDGRSGYFFSVAFASWLSVVLASSACAFELALSGTSPLALALPAMAGTHSIIGLGEALISVAVLTTVVAARLDIVPTWARIAETGKKPGNIRPLMVAGLSLALVLALFLSPLASAAPDGLEKVAETQGFLAKAEGVAFWTQSPFADYAIAAVPNESVSTSLAGLIGTLVVFAFGYIVIRRTVGRKALSADGQKL